MKVASLTVLCLSMLVGTTAVADPASPPPTIRKIDWAKMNAAERKEYMKATVLPEMKKQFVSADAKKYADMSCQTCHGAKAESRQFKMPNPDLLKLPPPMEKAGFMALHQQKPEITKFMGSTVKPTMARLLGVEEWSTTNANGFGCYSCHMRQGDAPAPGLTAAKVVEPKPPESKPAPPAAPVVEAKPAVPAAELMAAEAKAKAPKPAETRSDKAKARKGKETSAKTKTAKAKEKPRKAKAAKGKKSKA